MKNKQGLATIYVVLAGISWSFAGVLSKFSEWNALSIAGYRFLFGALVLGISRRSFKIKITRGNVIGAIGAISTSVLFMFANKHTSTANAIVLQYASTAIVIVAQAVIFKIRLRRLDVLAAIFVIAGVILCFCQSIGGGGVLGDAAGILSAFTWATVFLASRMPDADSETYSYMGCLAGSLLIISMFFDPAVSAGGVRAAFAPTLMAICFALGYMFFGMGMRKSISPSVAAVISNIEPVLSPTWVFLFLGENPGIFSIAGAVVVLLTVTVYSLLNNKMERQIGEDA